MMPACLTVTLSLAVLMVSGVSGAAPQDLLLNTLVSASGKAPPACASPTLSARSIGSIQTRLVSEGDWFIQLPYVNVGLKLTALNSNVTSYNLLYRCVCPVSLSAPPCAQGEQVSCGVNTTIVMDDCATGMNETFQLLNATTGCALSPSNATNPVFAAGTVGKVEGLNGHVCGLDEYYTPHLYYTMQLLEVSSTCVPGPSGFSSHILNVTDTTVSFIEYQTNNCTLPTRQTYAGPVNVCTPSPAPHLNAFEFVLFLPCAPFTSSYTPPPPSPHKKNQQITIACLSVAIGGTVSFLAVKYALRRKRMSYNIIDTA